MSKIYWTTQENARVVKQYAYLRYKNPHWPMVRLFREAMELALPPERVRPIASNTPGKWASENEILLRGALAEILEEESKTRVQEPEPVVAPVVQADPMHELLVTNMLKLLHDPRIQEALTAIVHGNKLFFEAPPKLKHSPVPQQVPREKLPKVMIVGLLKHQMGEVEKSHGSKFQLVFKGADADRDQVKAQAQTCDFVVSMTKFISHDVEGHMQRHAKQLKRCNGSVTDLQRILTASIKG